MSAAPAGPVTLVLFPVACARETPVTLVRHTPALLAALAAATGDATDPLPGLVVLTDTHTAWETPRLAACLSARVSAALVDDAERARHRAWLATISPGTVPYPIALTLAVPVDAVAALFEAEPLGQAPAAWETDTTTVALAVTTQRIQARRTRTHAGRTQPADQSRARLRAALGLAPAPRAPLVEPPGEGRCV